MIRIIADTTSGIPPAEAAKLGIGYIPQIIVIGDQSYRDDNEITTEQFLEKLKTSPVLPKTAAPPPALYTPLYEKFVAAGDTILVLCPSKDVSGTVRSATVAAQDFPNADIRIVDTRTIGPALGTLVHLALQWIKEGVDADTIVERVKEKGKFVRIYFYVDTLEYLHKGGRIGSASALVGSIMQIKPILRFFDGEVSPFEKQRTKQRALARISELIKKECPPTADSHLAILEADAMDVAEALRADFSSALKLDEISILDLPPAIVVHAGPGVVGVSFFTK